jgi:signal transduction histidine kinase
MIDRSASPLDRALRADTEPVRLIDVAVALGLAALSVIPFVGGASTIGRSDAATLALLLLLSLPLVVRRRYPLEVFLVVVTAAIVQVALVPEGQSPTAGLGILVAMYTIGERLERQVSVPLAALAGVVLGVLLLGRGALPQSLPSVIQTEVILAVAWLVGDAARIRRLYTDALEERTRLLDREREERSRRAVLEERGRIALELHDVVGHHVSVIVVQSGGALSALDKRPADARTALEAIGNAGRQALVDMRRLIGILGQDDAADPMPGLDQLGTLVERVRSAGLDVRLTIEGDQRPLDPGLELSAYRIVQEALTNSLRHAVGGRTSALVRYATDALEITIDDEGGSAKPGIEPDHEGRGLVGMRERVKMFRGTLEAGPTPTGFRVVARLPYPVSPGS